MGMGVDHAARALTRSPGAAQHQGTAHCCRAGQKVALADRHLSLPCFFLSCDLPQPLGSEAAAAVQACVVIE